MRHKSVVGPKFIFLACLSTTQVMREDPKDDNWNLRHVGRYQFSTPILLPFAPSNPILSHSTFFLLSPLQPLPQSTGASSILLSAIKRVAAICLEIWDGFLPLITESFDDLSNEPSMIGVLSQKLRLEKKKKTTKSTPPPLPSNLVGSNSLKTNNLNH